MALPIWLMIYPMMKADFRSIKNVGVLAEVPVMLFPVRISVSGTSADKSAHQYFVVVRYTAHYSGFYAKSGTCIACSALLRNHNIDTKHSLLKSQPVLF